MSLLFVALNQYLVAYTNCFSGYGCYDHFLEGELMFQENGWIMYAHKRVVLGDTYLHSWEVLAAILKSDVAKDMILDIGM